MQILLGVSIVMSMISIGAFLMANRVSLKAKMKNWRGESLPVGERDRTEKILQLLRVVAMVCGAIAVLTAIATVTVANYLSF